MGKKKVVQIYEQVTVKKVEKIKEPESQVDELLGDLNPKYFEEVISLKKAKEKIYASEVNFSSKFNMFRPY